MHVRYPVAIVRRHASLPYNTSDRWSTSWFTIGGGVGVEHPNIKIVILNVSPRAIRSYVKSSTILIVTGKACQNLTSTWLQVGLNTHGAYFCE